jgi:hypothetical protein
MYWDLGMFSNFQGLLPQDCRIGHYQSQIPQSGSLGFLHSGKAAVAVAKACLGHKGQQRTLEPKHLHGNRDRKLFS